MIIQSKKKTWRFLAVALLGVMIFMGGCAREDDSLVVYCGGSLKRPFEDIIAAFEQEYDVEVHPIYAGIITLRDTIEETKKGDYFIYPSSDPSGRMSVFENDTECVAVDELIIIVHKDNPENIQSFTDLAKPGIRLAVGDADKALGGIKTEILIQKSELREQLEQNIVIETPSLPQLLNLLEAEDVDAAIVLKNMLTWPESQEFIGIEIPADLRETIEIRAAVLTTTEDEKTARLFADFVALQGKAIFTECGFGEK